MSVTLIVILIVAYLAVGVLFCAAIGETDEAAMVALTWPLWIALFAVLEVAALLGFATARLSSLMWNRK